MFWTRANPRPFLFLRTPIFVGQSGHGRVGLIVDFDYSAEYQIVRLSKCIIFCRNQIVTILDFSLIINSYLMLGLLPNDIIIQTNVLGNSVNSKYSQVKHNTMSCIFHCMSKCHKIKNPNFLAETRTAQAFLFSLT